MCLRGSRLTSHTVQPVPLQGTSSICQMMTEQFPDYRACFYFCFPFLNLGSVHKPNAVILCVYIIIATNSDDVIEKMEAGEGPTVRHTLNLQASLL